MANPNNPRGLSPVGSINGGPFSGRVSRYYMPSSDTNAAGYIGALVKPAGSADANGIMTVTANVSTGNPVIGVIVSVEPITRDSTVYRENSTSRYVYVADDPNTLFEVQVNGVGLAAADIGNVADLTAFTSGSATTGLSSTQVSASALTASGDGTEDVVILGLAQRPDNAFGVSAKAIVRLNNHFLVDGQAGA